MRTRDTLVGLIVLGLVIAGVVWVRGVQRSGPSASAERLGPPPEPLRARSSPDTDAATPDVTVADGVVDVADLRVTLSVAPRPPVAFAKTQFRVRVESRGTPVVPEGGRISFEMTMPMGNHRYTLVAGEGGWQEAEVVLPFCKSGNPRWHALVEGTVGGRPFAARFRVDLTRPGAAPAP